MITDIESANKVLEITPTDYQLSQWCRPKGDIIPTLLAPYVKSIYFIPEDFKDCTCINDVRVVVLERANQVQLELDCIEPEFRKNEEELEDIKRYAISEPINPLVLVCIVFVISLMFGIGLTEELTLGFGVALAVSVVYGIVKFCRYFNDKETFEYYNNRLSEFKSRYAEFISSVKDQYPWFALKLAENEAREQAKQLAEEEKARLREQAHAEWRKRQVEQAAIRSVVYTGTKTAMKGLSTAIKKHK